MFRHRKVGPASTPNFQKSILSNIESDLTHGTNPRLTREEGGGGGGLPLSVPNNCDDLKTDRSLDKIRLTM